RQHAALIADFDEIARGAARFAAIEPIGLKRNAVGAQLHQRLGREDAIAAPYADTAAILPGAATVGNEAIVLDADRVFGLHPLDRHVRQVLRGIGDRLEPVLVGPAAP